ncbi:MAG TPA: TlpA disulfide reductase family protein [Bryobacteraceae bacterium]|jgi:peroxiredoxin|nr:TlpA disulfide reductase family protein [Bryobacteraceae bacterium]
MRKSLIMLTLAGAFCGALLSTTLFAATPPKREPAVPRKAAEFDFRMLDGSHKLLSTYRGKTVILGFFFTTCPHCEHTAQLLMKMRAAYASKGVEVLAVVFEEGAPARMKQFVTETGLTFPLTYSDQGMVLEFLQYPPTAPYMVPVLVFIDKGGTVRGEYGGDDKFLTNEEPNIRAEIERVLKLGSAPATGKP